MRSAHRSLCLVITKSVDKTRESNKGLRSLLIDRRGTVLVKTARITACLGKTSSFTNRHLTTARTKKKTGDSDSDTPKRAIKMNAVKQELRENEKKQQPKPIYLRDYKKPAYEFESVFLSFQLNEDLTKVESEIRVKVARKGEDMFLNGDKSIVLEKVEVDGVQVMDDCLKRTEQGLILMKLPEKDFELKIVTLIKPQENTALEGLYKSSGNYCTQCEAEGFRRITFYQDRPDVMSKFTTRMEASKDKYPVLLSNGNLIDSGDSKDGRHFAVWEDPWVKPCYLFALVAGNLAKIEDKFTTMSGKNVDLRIYTEPHNIDKADHAMVSLIKSMKWDEDTFGLEYDLELFNIVAVDDFNMGAMENKSLNVFNSRLVFATPKTATDADYAAIEGVVGHEYFHNWTGNRVTCRDWFQLSLKEGLTVYRDQEFSADMNSRGVKRIGDVSKLRMAQFPQDSGPMAHPIRPEEYIKMDNFYTVTVYEKGAEVVRMYESLLGKDGFRKGMDLYFERHDGSAVTTEDFFNAMADANKTDLSAFKPWYSQAGTPLVDVKTSYDASKKTFTLTAKQQLPSTPGQDASQKKAVLMPIRVGLLDKSSGKDIEITSVNGVAQEKGTTTAILRFDQAEQTFTFENVSSDVVPSILRNFSAPIKMTTDLQESDLLFLMGNDSDAFNRWEAGQTLLRSLLVKLIGDEKSGKTLEMNKAITDALRKTIEGATAADSDKAFIARAMMVPTESELVEMLEPGTVDPDVVKAARKFVMKSLASDLRSLLEETAKANSASAYSNEPADRAMRSLKNTCLGYLSYVDAPEVAKDALDRFQKADNMTDKIATLSALSDKVGDEREKAYDTFYEDWKHDPLVMCKWLSLQAASGRPNNLANVKALMDHPAFDIKNPNKVYSLIGGFMSNPTTFHQKDGQGYEFLADVVLKLNAINQQVAARMVGGFTRWRKYDPSRQALMKAQLERIIATDGLSENVYEIVKKSLD
jgi:aminopeptidase N